MITVPVELGDRSYDVLVGAGARHRLLEVLPVGVQRAAVVTQAAVGWDVDPGVDDTDETALPLFLEGRGVGAVGPNEGHGDSAFRDAGVPATLATP